MLDTDTKRRIDTARDILVGKVPDPKSQVEQITIALIYKFMDDMDNESREMGGEASFFANDFEKFRWTNLIDTRLGGHERLNLYTEAISRLPQNPGMPQLFRDIFKNAFLPYRDPETLSLFLKTINEFRYDHSERLGDAFEYLLSVLGSQGDAGQFRTPRHIIDFMVQVLDPKKDETILDPACGTAGFLISSYKHIVAQNTKKTPGDLLTPSDRKRLVENFRGFDISPDMVRLSLVNMYLHQFTNPQIFEYDTLTSEDRWNEHYDVILANPPFMSPKGGIKPHNKFSIPSNRSEVLFVDYIAEHLLPNGRAAIIVPEGIIFQTATAHKALRKMLVEGGFLWAVISLPAGVFNPYSGVKTSILLLDKHLAKKTDKILFVKIGNDGFGLGAQRREIIGSDLPDALRLITTFQEMAASGKELEIESMAIANSSRFDSAFVEKIRIAENEWILSSDRYRESESGKNSHFNFIPLGKALERVNEIINPESFSGKVNYIGLENIEPQTGQLIGDIETDFSEIKSAKLKFKSGDLLYGKLRPNLNKVWLAKFDGISSTDIFVLRGLRGLAETRFLLPILRSEMFNREVLNGLKGAQLPRVDFNYFSNIQIPLPPLYIQQQIVEEIEGYRRIIDGARQVVENYRPRIQVDPKWEMINLGEICVNLDSQRKPVTKSDRNAGIYPYYGASGIVDYVEDYIFDERLLLVSEDGANLLARVTPIAFSVIGKVWVNNHAHVLRFKEPATQKFVEFYLNQTDLANYITGSAQPKLNQASLNNIPIPFPPLQVQQRIVAKIEKEQALVEANQELITIFEQKTRDRIADIWEEKESKN